MQAFMGCGLTQSVVHELNFVCESAYVFVRECMTTSAKGARQLSGLSQLDVGS